MLYFLLITLSFILLYAYKSFAKKARIFSIENNRTLHKGNIPRGAGIVFGFVYLISLNILPHEIQKDFKLFFPIIMILSSSLIVGFYDDLYDIDLKKKFLLQFLISLLLVYIFMNPIINFTGFIFFLISVVIVNWCLNIANFLDGIDGLLSSISISISLIILFLLNINDLTQLNSIILYFMSFLLTFLIFNWSPAKIFMGDSGSLFIGSYFCILCFLIIKNNFIDFWILVIVFSYAITETTLTLLIRIYLGQGWKKTHRSHGYQNLARLWDNHSKVTIYINLYHILILFPLATISIYFKEASLYLSLISIFLSVIFVYKYGPRLNSS